MGIMAINYSPSKSLLVTIVSVVVCVIAVETNEPGVIREKKCENITIEMCQNLPYNQTIIPNYLGYVTQEEAALQIYPFIPLVRVPGCDIIFRMYLCLQYSPICTISGHVIPPCRSVCQLARNECEPLMTKYGMQWPSYFNCDSLPNNVMDSQTPCVLLEQQSVLPD